jgi:ribonuclease P protein component
MATGEELCEGRPIGRLKRSAEFQRLRQGKRLKAKFGDLHGVARGADATAGLRVGLIVPKRLGNAPRRNRIKRRLREALRRAQRLGLLDQTSAHGSLAGVGIDIGILPSQGAAELDFDALAKQLGSAVGTLMRRLGRLPI